MHSLAMQSQKRLLANPIKTLRAPIQERPAYLLTKGNLPLNLLLYLRKPRQTHSRRSNQPQEIQAINMPSLATTVGYV